MSCLDIGVEEFQMFIDLFIVLMMKIYILQAAKDITISEIKQTGIGKLKLEISGLLIPVFCSIATHAPCSQTLSVRENAEKYP